MKLTESQLRRIIREELAATKRTAASLGLPGLSKVGSIIMDACMKDPGSMRAFKNLMRELEESPDIEVDIDMIVQYVQDARGPERNRSMDPELYADEAEELVIEAYKEAGITEEIAPTYEQNVVHENDELEIVAPGNVQKTDRGDLTLGIIRNAIKDTKLTGPFKTIEACDAAVDTLGEYVTWFRHQYSILGNFDKLSKDKKATFLSLANEVEELYNFVAPELTRMYAAKETDKETRRKTRLAKRNVVSLDAYRQK